MLSGRLYSIPFLSSISLSVVSVTHSQPWSENIKWKTLRKKQFFSFSLQAILTSGMKSCSVSTASPPGIPSHQHHLLLTSNPWHDHGSVIQDHRSRWAFWWQINSSLTLCHDASVVHSLQPITLARYDLMLSQVEEGYYSTIRCFERQREHIHRTFITEYCYNCSIFSSHC